MASKLGPFEVGQVWALHREGFSHRDIAERVTRGRDGEGPTVGAICQVVQRLDAEPTWTGDRASGSGRKRKTTPAEDKALVRAAKRHRGSQKINSTTLQVLASPACRVSNRTIRRRLRASGLRYLRRRSKTLVPRGSVAARLAWASWVKMQSRPFLARWVYTDGASFYLGRTDGEHESAARLALGLHVWREHATKDALYKDCVGPSSYAKAQGAAVRIWGVLCGRRLYVRVLPQGTVMNRVVYANIIKKDFPRWLRRARHPFLVQDHERALWCDEPRKALRDAGVELSGMHPKHSPDLNAIENVWALLRLRLADTMPAAMERRAEFIARLRAAIAWLNRNRGAAMLKLGRNMKVRARDVEDVGGYRTKW